jgi:hypothetical protein
VAGERDEYGLDQRTRDQLHWLCSKAVDDPADSLTYRAQQAIDEIDTAYRKRIDELRDICHERLESHMKEMRLRIEAEKEMISLRAALAAAREAAYREGFSDGVQEGSDRAELFDRKWVRTADDAWQQSDTYAAMTDTQSPEASDTVEGETS